MDTRENIAKRFAQLAIAIGAQAQSFDGHEAMETWGEAWPKLYNDVAEVDQDWFNLILLSTLKEVFNDRLLLHSRGTH